MVPQISYTRDGSFGVNGNLTEDGTVVSNSGGYIVTNSGQYLYGIDLGRIEGSVFSSTPMSSTALNAGLTGVSDVKNLNTFENP